MRRLRKDTSGQYMRYIAYNAHGDTLQLYIERDVAESDEGVQRLLDLAEQVVWGPIEYIESPDGHRTYKNEQ